MPVDIDVVNGARIVQRLPGKRCAHKNGRRARGRNSDGLFGAVGAVDTAPHGFYLIAVDSRCKHFLWRPARMACKKEKPTRTCLRQCVQRRAFGRRERVIVSLVTRWLVES
jgi:hypothetical protein